MLLKTPGEGAQRQTSSQVLPDCYNLTEAGAGCKDHSLFVICEAS